MFDIKLYARRWIGDQMGKSSLTAARGDSPADAGPTTNVKSNATRLNVVYIARVRRTGLARISPPTSRVRQSRPHASTTPSTKAHAWPQESMW